MGEVAIRPGRAEDLSTLTELSGVEELSSLLLIPEFLLVPELISNLVGMLA